MVAAVPFFITSKNNYWMGMSENYPFYYSSSTSWYKIWK